MLSIIILVGIYLTIFRNKQENLQLMSIAHFLIFSADPSTVDENHAQFPEQEISALTTLPGVERIDRYEPTLFEDDPYDDDRQDQVLTIQTSYRDIVSLEQGLASTEFHRLVNAVAAGSVYKLSHDAMDTVYYPVADESEPRELTAPISYVVRYHYPANDVEQFIDYYTSHHPQIERRFPRITNIMCYLPIKWRDPTSLPYLGYMLGNEVVFESVEDLGNALTSPVIDEMSADFQQFPPFQGPSTHYPMHRRRVA